MSLDRLQIPEVENDYVLTPLTSIPEVYFQKKFLERQKVMRRWQRWQSRTYALGLGAAWLAAIATLAGIWWRFFR